MGAMDRDELAAWLRLALTPQVGPITARRLLTAFGLPQNLFEQPRTAWAEFVTPAQAQGLSQAPAELEAQVVTTLAWLSEAEGHRILTLADPAYPAGLLETEDPPLMLYVMGALPREAAWPHAVAMVGSRNPTAQGAANARQFARTFAEGGWTVVSGLALGIDGAAHEGALEGASPPQLATIAVVGTGLDRVYPKRHLDLAHRIAQQGLIVSEYPLGTPPLAPNFPRRNRLIAGLSRGTLVVEAALQSGSLITARMAVEQGKEVFAIPGSIHSAQSRGCHALLKQGAKLVETAQDVLEELMPGSRADATAATGSLEASAPRSAHGQVLAALGFDPATLDMLVDRTGLPTATLQAWLLELELDGHVARLAGGQFQRIAST